MTETRSRADEEEPAEDRQPPVSAHRCSGERTVFTEDGNTDGWIATDLTVSLQR